MDWLADRRQRPLESRVPLRLSVGGVRGGCRIDSRSACDALLLSGGVWLASQTIAFASLHHHMTDVALTWGVAMGVITLLSCEAAGLATRRMKGLVGAGAAFVAAFVVYKGLIFGFGVAMVSSVGHFDSLLATLPRIFLINACVFAGLGALYALGSAARRNGEAVALAPRHV